MSFSKGMVLMYRGPPQKGRWDGDSAYMDRRALTACMQCRLQARPIDPAETHPLILCAFFSVWIYLKESPLNILS